MKHSEDILEGRALRSRAFHALAIAIAVATLPLIFMGGLVTSHGAGLSVPDWPNSYGYNMFLFPPRLWVGGILYEHTHRLMGTVVGALSVALVAVAFLSNRTTRAQRTMSLVVLGGVLFQGLLGGLRVVLVKLGLAMVHACVAQAFFCLAAYVAVASSAWWRTPRDRALKPSRAVFVLGMVTVGLVYVQLIIAATMRHTLAGLAIPDLPLAYGHVLPPTTGAELDAANAMRAAQFDLAPVTLWQIWLHFAHRVGAVVVTGAVLALCAATLRRYGSESKLARPAVLLPGLIALQVTLGVLTVLYRKPADVASAHVAVGAVVLVTCFVLTVRAGRLMRKPAAGEMVRASERAGTALAGGLTLRPVAPANESRNGNDLATSPV